MTDRETLQIIKSMIDAQLAQNVIPPPFVPPPQPPSSPGGPPPANIGTDGSSFTWQRSGEVIQYAFTANVPVSFGYDVPPFYGGTVGHVILPLIDSVQDVHLRMWESETPNGSPIPNTLYDGAWNAGGIMNVGPFSPAPGRRYFLNVQVSQNSRYGVQQQHQ